MTPVLSLGSREANLARLRSEEFDVLILGGGINGAGIARDLALRGVRVALVERGHFGSGTSGRNSHLIHGGLRYLKYLQFRLVRESLRERATLLEIAPHLVEPQPFLMPFYGRIARAFYGTGLWLYDRLAGGGGLPPHRGLGPESVRGLEPGLDRAGLAGGSVFYDARVRAARLVLENIFDAARAGAVVVNYAAGHGREMVDVATGKRFTVRARKVVDARGPWEADVRLVRGSHLLLPRVTAGDHAIAWFESSGRIFFVIPWPGDRSLSLVGTTDCDHTGGPDAVCIAPEEREYMLRVVRRLFPATSSLEPLGAFCSLRPLVKIRGPAVKASREHRIWNTPDGVLHVAGGKYTTYRAMSQQAADAVCAEIAPGATGQCTTAATPLGGNSRAALEALRISMTGEPARLIAYYGVETPNVLAWLPHWGKPVRGAPQFARPVAYPTPGVDSIESARIAYAAHHEMARRLPDLLFVSTTWGFERRWNEASLRPYAVEFGRHFNWDEARTAAEIRLSLEMAWPFL